MNQKIIISPLNEIISSSEQNFLNDKCNLILNDGNPLLIDLNSSSFISSTHSKNSNINFCKIKKYTVLLSKCS